ncbi:MAG: LytTR family DNA-binding domain-containing protein [Lachnospiraceae bacterium]|nr:LytTR family DNA-binding domain-containing protein [Lachnospiraceae bacterium]
MIKIAICDDESSQIKLLRRMLDAYSKNRNETFYIRDYSGGEELMADVSGGDLFDIYILDILMPQKNGIMLGKDIRDYDENGMFLYLTSSSEFALQSYEVRAFHYLLKPVEPEKFFHVFQDMVKLINERKRQQFQVKTKEGSVLIDFDKLIYAELDGRCILYHLSGNKVLRSVSFSGSFRNKMDPILTDERFCLCGASFLINLQYIKSVEKTGIIFIDDTGVELPKSSCSQLRSIWTEYWQPGMTD